MFLGKLLKNYFTDIKNAFLTKIKSYDKKDIKLREAAIKGVL